MTMYLGIDYGEKHIGVAIADGPLATPLISLDMDPHTSIQHIAKIVLDHNVQKIVVGLPEGKLQGMIRKFGSDISHSTGISVVYHEETLSTKEAVQALREAGASRKKLMNDHVYAACVILEDYLENTDRDKESHS